MTYPADPGAGAVGELPASAAAPFWRQVGLVAGKDLRIEARSRVLVGQLVPFGLCVLLLFAFALDPDRGVLRRVAPGLIWLAELFCTVLVCQRSQQLEESDGALDTLLLIGLDPAAVFLGKAAAVTVVLLCVEVVLGLGGVVFFGAEPRGLGLLVAAGVPATCGLAGAGTLYGALAGGSRARDTLLPLLLLPAVAPVLIGATRAWEAGLDGAAADGWRWVALLAVFAAVYVGSGALAYGALVEDS